MSTIATAPTVARSAQAPELIKRGVPRRTIAAGLGWSAPALTMAMASPAYAASPSACPAMQTSPWPVQVQNPSRVGGVNVWDDNVFANFQDAPANLDLIATTTGDLTNLVIGREYILSVDIWAEFGHFEAQRSTNAWLTIAVGGQTIFTGSTRQRSGAVNLRPEELQWNTFSTTASGAPISFIASATSMSLTYIFTAERLNSVFLAESSDDIRVTRPTFVGCVRS